MEEHGKHRTIKHSSKSVTIQPEVVEKFDTPELKVEEPSIYIHPPSELPIPSDYKEKENEIIFLDPSIGEGKRILSDEATTIPQLFALMRQFIVPVCNNFSLLVDEMRHRNIGINDVDATTGMTMLHYAVRAASLAERRALAVVRRLLDGGADPQQRCLYSNMNALHIAAYFDLSSACLLFLKTSDGKPPAVEVDSLCESFHFGTSLHIAASSLSCKSVEVLLEKGASYNAKDDLDRTAQQCIPDNLTSAIDFNKANHIKEMLSRYSGDTRVSIDKQHFKGYFSKLIIGSRVTFAVSKPVENDFNKTVVMIGTLRYLGAIPSSDDEWAGIELDTPDGNNSGNIGNEFLFNCRQNYGIFVEARTVTPVTKKEKLSRKSRSPLLKGTQDKSIISKCGFRIGDRVRVSDTGVGTIGFIGTTHFAPGLWCGIELDSEGTGRNNGSVEGVSYFTCLPSRGVFSSPKNLIRLHGHRAQVEATEERKRSPTPLRNNKTPLSQRRTKRDVNPLPTSNIQEIPSFLSTDSVKTRDLYKRSERPSDVGTSRPLSLCRALPKSMAYLRTGMRVDVKGTNQNAIIKYIGETDFSSGVWVGLDLGIPQGRNDGSVKGRRYFNCLTKHGVMLRPARILYKGVSGASMLPPGLGASSANKK